MFDTNKSLSTFLTRSAPTYLGSNLLDFFDSLDQVARFNENYPPRNIRSLNAEGTKHVIEFALAGWSADDINVYTEKGWLHVKSERKVKENDDQADAGYIHRGISEKNFELRFKLAERVDVTNAHMENGLLSIYTEVIVPEEEKPKLVKITKQS